MLHDNRHVRFDDTREISVSRDGFRIVQVIKSDVSGSAARNRKAVRPSGIAIGKIDGDLDLSVAVGCVQDADRFMARELRFRTMAVRRNVSLSNCPALGSNDIHSTLWLRFFRPDPTPALTSFCPVASLRDRLPLRARGRKSPLAASAEFLRRSCRYCYRGSLWL